MRDRLWSAMKVAVLLNRKPSTVRQWACDQREIPEHALEVLENLAAKERRAVGV